MSMIERAVSRLGDEALPARGSVTDLSAWADAPPKRQRRPEPTEAGRDAARGDDPVPLERPARRAPPASPEAP
ncbi:MAG: hypothetical protein WCK28_18985, partial [Burkholderiales bacterium]